MKQVLVIARHEFQALFRERILLSLLSVFLLMAAVSSFIGWQTVHTTSAIYQAAVAYLASHGGAALPPNPLSSLPAISYFRNLTVYIFLIGSLFAIVIGHRSFMRERKAGVVPLLLTRPLSSITLIAGKMIGITVSLLSVLTATFLISWLSSLLLPFQHLTNRDTVRLTLFFVVSLLYLFFFSLLGMGFAAVARNESLALFLPVGVWIGISFVLPELATGQTPTALLNPVTIGSTVVETGFFSLTQRLLTPLSLGGHYTSLSSSLLSDTTIPSGSLITMVVFVLLATATCLALGRGNRLVSGRSDG